MYEIFTNNYLIFVFIVYFNYKRIFQIFINNNFNHSLINNNFILLYKHIGNIN